MPPRRNAPLGRAHTEPLPRATPRAPLDVEAALGELQAALSARATPARAESEKRYLKSELTFLGVTVPEIRRAAKAFARAHPELERKSLRALAELAWSREVHEFRSVAIGILEARAQALTPADLRWLIELVRRSNTWAHVDWLAIKVIGAVVAAHPGSEGALDRWSTDASFWVRRTALLALHDPLARGEGDFDHFARLAAPLLGERELFIRKAIGWVLRATSKKRPALTTRFVEAHARAMSALTFREATRHLPSAQVERLAARRRK